MRRFLFFVLASGLLASGASAQVVATSPAANALGASRTAAVAATLAGAPASGATLRLFSSQAGGRRAGATTTTASGLSFLPSTSFRAGETLMATVTAGLGSARVWQFTAAATGTGSFGGGSDLYFSAYPYGQTLLSLAVGDLTGDGSLDVLARETGTNPSSLFTNNGAGQLSHAGFPLGASYDWRMLPPLGDLDGDGLLDLVPGINTGAGSLSYTLNPTYFPRSEYDGVLADLDGDGDLDYAYTYSSQLRIATNTGSGALAFTLPAVPLAADGYLSPGDFDGDGDVDLVHFSLSGSGSLAVLRNNGQGVFALSATYPAPVSTPFQHNHTVAVGDLDGDGDLDLVVPLQSLNTTAATNIWANNGQGFFTAPTYPATSATPGIGNGYTVCLGDVDGDGDLDVLTGGATAQLFLNNGSRGFALSYTLAGMNAYGGALLADMNNDGALDIVAAQPGSTPGGPGTAQPGHLAVRLNNTVLATSSSSSLSHGRPWPNPVAAGSPLHLAATGSATTATLHTLAGQPVRKVCFAGAASDLPTAGLAPGLYVLLVQPTGQLPLAYRVAVD